MNYFNGVLAAVDRRFADIRRRYEQEDARDVSQQSRRARMKGTPLSEDIRGSPKCPSGLNPHVYALAWASRQHDDNDKSWTELAKRTRMSFSGLQNEVRRFIELGGEVEGTIMNSKELSIHAVAMVAKHLGVEKPCDDDLAKRIGRDPDARFLTGTGKGAEELREYAMKRGFIKTGLADMGFTPAEMRGMAALLGRAHPTLKNARKFLDSHNEEKQETIAMKKGIRSASSLLAHMRSAIPHERAKENRMHREASVHVDEDISDVEGEEGGASLPEGGQE